MRILIAEDDRVLADGLLRSLRGSGYAVDHVGSGSEADAAPPLRCQKYLGGQRPMRGYVSW